MLPDHSFILLSLSITFTVFLKTDVFHEKCMLFKIIVQPQFRMNYSEIFFNQSEID